MKKRFLALLLLPLLLGGCSNNGSSDVVHNATSLEHTRKTGEIADFHLTGPENGFVTDTGFTFTWEKAENADNYQIEIASTQSFVNDDAEEDSY